MMPIRIMTRMPARSCIFPAAARCKQPAATAMRPMANLAAAQASAATEKTNWAVIAWTLD